MALLSPVASIGSTVGNFRAVGSVLSGAEGSDCVDVAEPLLFCFRWKPFIPVLKRNDRVEWSDACMFEGEEVGHAGVLDLVGRPTNRKKSFLNLLLLRSIPDPGVGCVRGVHMSSKSQGKGFSLDGN